ncbi:MAG TPA: SprT family zinc-dependent metalloprotease [Anaerolineales bacterium]
MKIDRLIRTKRKTIALVVEIDGSLTVRAPLRLSQKRILELVDQKVAWIQSKQAQARTMPPAVKAKAYVDGEIFWFLGKPYPLEIVPKARQPLKLEDKFYLAESALPKAGAVFTAWYKAQAAQILVQKAHQAGEQLGLAYRQLKITSAQGRWGSCTSQGTICFTWRLVMAPPAEIEYVVVHELIHLVEKNHSKKFWGKVEAILPDFKARRQWLKDNNHLLIVQF